MTERLAGPYDQVPPPKIGSKQPRFFARVNWSTRTRGLEYRILGESIPDSFGIHSGFIALSLNEARKNDVAGYRNGGGARESSSKGKEEASKSS